MNLLDIILIAAVAIGGIVGYRLGLVKQLSFGAGLAIGLFQAIHSYPDVGKWVNDATGWEEGACYTAGFILILLAITSIVYLLGVVFSKIIRIICLGMADRILGTIFAIYFSMTTMAAIVDITGRIDPHNPVTGETSQEDSVLYKKIVGTTFSVIEEVIKER